MTLAGTMKEALKVTETMTPRVQAIGDMMVAISERLKQTETMTSRLHRAFYEGNGDSLMVQVNAILAKLESLDGDVSALKMEFHNAKQARQDRAEQRQREQRAERWKFATAISVALIALTGVIVEALR